MAVNKAENNSANDEKLPSELQKAAESYRSGWAYAEYAFQYGVAIVICTLGGYWLDKWLNTGNIFMITGVVVGSVAGFIGLLKSLNVLKFNKPDSKQKSGTERK
jgi:F0F1-type ATP synthase assembly protein I